MPARDTLIGEYGDYVIEVAMDGRRPFLVDIDTPEDASNIVMAGVPAARETRGAMSVTIDSINQASGVIAGHVVRTPCVHSRTLSTNERGRRVREVRESPVYGILQGPWRPGEDRFSRT